MNTFDVISEFKQYWQNNGHKTNSVSSYVSYIKKAIAIFVDYQPVKDNGIDTLFPNIQLVKRSGKDENKITRDIKFLFRIALKESGNSLGAKKTYNNSLSGITTFFNWLYMNNLQYEHDANTAKLIKKALVESNSQNIIFNYSTKDIYKNFNTRINTQDRVYEHICLNFCLINAVLNLDKSLFKNYGNMKKNKLFSTKFIIDPNTKDSIPLSSVKELIIRPTTECTIIDDKGIKHSVYTEADPFDGTCYEDLKSIDINELSIDHDVPLNDLIGKQYYNYPNIIKLSEMIARYFNYAGNDYKRIKPQIDKMKQADAENIIQNEHIDSVFANLIFQDIQKLYNSMGYSIMYGPYNSKKSG